MSIGKTSKTLFRKNDFHSLFKLNHKTEIVSAKDIQHRKSPKDAEERSIEYARQTLEGKYPKRDPLSVWKVDKENGSSFYSLRDGNTTYQMLKNQGWDKFPVIVEKEIPESELTPVSEHQKKISRVIKELEDRLGATRSIDRGNYRLTHRGEAL